MPWLWIAASFFIADVGESSISLICSLFSFNRVTHSTIALVAEASVYLTPSSRLERDKAIANRMSNHGKFPADQSKHVLG